MRSPFILSLCLFWVSLSAHAVLDEQEYSLKYRQCQEKAMSTADIIDCITAENKRQDKRLNTAYQQLHGALSSDRQQALLEAQRLWIQYRDANCAFYDDPEGGTNARIHANQCVLDTTAARAQELEDLGEPGEEE